MGESETGLEVIGELEQQVEAGKAEAAEFLQPGDEDYNEDLKHETVEETHKRTIAALKAKDESTQTDGADPGNKDQKAQKQPTANDNTKQQQIGAIPAPDRFTAEAKAAWAKAPRALQEQLGKTIRDLEIGQQQKLRQIHELKTAAETIVQAVKPWVKDWATRNISPGQGIALLARTHEKMLENPAAEIARLIKDNEITLEDVQAVINGGDGAQGAGRGMEYDITKHPEFVALRQRLDSYDNESRQNLVKAETDKIIALRDQQDQAGNKPYGFILEPEFLRYAQPLVSALRTPPRGPDGKFTGGPPLSIEAAYKKAYFTWLYETGKAAQLAAPRNQPNGTNAPRQRAEPVSMRPRNKPVGAAEVNSRNSADFRGETVEQTMERLRKNGWR